MNLKSKLFLMILFLVNCKFQTFTGPIAMPLPEMHVIEDIQLIRANYLQALINTQNRVNNHEVRQNNRNRMSNNSKYIRIAALSVWYTLVGLGIIGVIVKSLKNTFA